MRVHLTGAGTIVLVEPSVFNKLDVLVDPQPPQQLDRSIARIGSRDGADHVRLTPSVLRFLSSEAGNAEWDAQFDAMIQYAAGKGWLDEQGRVRAHTTWGETAGAASAFAPEAFKGRVAVVTGAGGGLGAGICERLRASGALVVQADIGYAEPPTEVQGMLAVRCDIGDPASVEALVALVRERYGRCDVLVNNAAITTGPEKLETFPLELWDRVFRVNLRGALLCAKALVPMMLERQSGSIVNVASITAHVASRAGAYGPAKAALCALTHQMAVEWGPRGVRANSVSPGMIRTPLSEVHYRDEAKLHDRVSKIPARRIGLPQDIGDAVAFLASDASAYVNGQDLVVDGGFLKATLVNLY
ncbi:SDR family NAD(P)-dependent oxidoreductase [Hydrogenophaga sp. BPS33]|uniref:SDR family NAD(P)-dependent oxidoreductase n=1 Tax=Hydrogenophaga sp. BPS33 TaxID=2651974 RepID=UPI001F477C9E|nr:SDR family oxidoreductase [Hydrogenophaga sp. BPS33]